MVPGIANCTETKYVRTFSDYAMRCGFRVAVLNHLGAKTKEGLSTPRIFTYGKGCIIIIINNDINNNNNNYDNKNSGCQQL